MLFRSGGKTWAPLGTGLPRSVVTGVRLNRPARLLRAATFGRGMWELELPLPQFKPPVLSTGGLVNAATLQAGSVAPGSIASVFGSNLAAAIIESGGAPLPRTLGGLGIAWNAGEFSPLAAPLFFAAPGQVNLQVPWEAKVGPTVVAPRSVDAFYRGIAATVAARAPGIFTTTQSGKGQGVIVISTGELAAAEGSIPGAATKPARAGD